MEDQVEVEVEYVSEKPNFDDYFIENFSKVFEKFKPLEEIYPTSRKVCKNFKQFTFWNIHASLFVILFTFGCLG